jgi:RND family efflux transporter, MFP subunit
MRKKIIVGIVIVGFIAGISAVYYLLNRNAGVSAFGSGKVYNVNVEKIQKGDISSYITANGVIEEVEKAEVFFDTPMKVKKVLANVGEKVSKGQKIIELDMESLNSELEKLKVNKKIQELSLDSKTASVEVERAHSALKNSEKSYDDSKKDWLDKTDLYASKAISKNELELSEKAYNQAEAALSDARLAYDSAVESSKLNKATAEENLKITNMSISDMEKNIDRINKAMSSPLDGVISVLNLEEGSFTSNMQPAYKVILPEKLQVKAKVKEYDIKNVKVGQSVRISGDAIEKEKNIYGKVEAISPVAVTNTTANGQETVIEVTVTIDNEAGSLKPGLNVTCDVFTVDRKDVVIAPMGVITEDIDGNKMVFVVDTNKNVMRQRKINLGINSDMNVEVLEGLKEGEMVVVDPLPVYKDGARVKISE